MKCNLPPRAVGSRGITLLELTVVILVMLSLITLLFIGSRAWRRGADRSACIMNLRNVQMATRSYQNMYDYDFGSQPRVQYGTHDIARHLLLNGYISQVLHDQAKGLKPCEGGGTYTSAAPEAFPMPGVLYMTCSLSASDEHAPEPTVSSGW